jgi:AcrR family transcriptional regulator
VSTKLFSSGVMYARGMTTAPSNPTPAQSRKPAGAAVLQPDKTDAIVAAFYDELAEGGHERLTMDRVAARAGVGKAALYRRWRSKEQMIAELVATLGGDEGTPAPDLGSLRDDLHAWFADAIALGQDPLLRQVMAYAIAMARSSPELIEAMRGVPGPDRDSARVILQRAIDRGELAPDTDLQIALDIITGPIWRRVMIAGDTLDPDYAKRITAMVLRALAADAAS